MQNASFGVTSNDRCPTARRTFKQSGVFPDHPSYLLLTKSQKNKFKWLFGRVRWHLVLRITVLDLDQMRLSEIAMSSAEDSVNPQSKWDPQSHRWPSLAAKEEWRRISEAEKHPCSIASQSTNSKENKALRFSISTQDALTDFAPIAAENVRKEGERELRLLKHRQSDLDLDTNRDDRKSGYQGLFSWVGQAWPLNCIKRPYHEVKDLDSLAKLHFPPRSEVRVYITDFKEHSAETYDCRLSEIASHWKSKPKEVHVRWIHAPLGFGPVHSTIEDLFRAVSPMGRRFVNLGRSGFPYAVAEVLNFRNRKQFQKTRDVYHLLHDEQKLTERLNACCWAGFEVDMLDDLKWRTTHLGLAEDWNTLPDFWTACNSDVSWQMSEGLIRSNYGPLEGLCPTLWQSDKQALHKHRFFGSAQLVRDPFRCFHREDGRLHVPL